MRFIATDRIPGLLGRLVESGMSVWAPQVVKDTVNTVLFAPWTGLEEISLDAYTMLSAKQLVLPATERLFSYRYTLEGGRERIGIEPSPPADKETAVFGARACDARALAALDALFLPEEGSGYRDPGYAAHRAGLTVITLACTTCDSACFCSSFGKGPAETAGSDLILYPVEGGLLAEPVTEKGSQIAAFDIFEDSEQSKPELATTACIDLEGIGDKFLGAFNDLDFWQRATENCLSCGYCTYACPACHCFNIFDEMSSDREGERCRSWDACMFYVYTLETSGHNPRPSIAHRYRNRVGHKFSYYPANQGELLCTGCGRCIRNCPGGLDVRNVLKGLAAVEAATEPGTRKPGPSGPEAGKPGTEGPSANGPEAAR